MKAEAKIRPRRALPSLNKRRLRLWLRLLRATRAIESELRERLRVEFDITLPQFDVMAAFNRPEHKNPIIFDSYAELETLYRGIKSLRIYEGASDVQKIIIARSVLS